MRHTATNHWFTGLVFGDKAEPVFPLPLGFALTSAGFELWLPKLVVNAKTIGGEQGPRLTLAVDGVTGGSYRAYDEASVVVQLRDASGKGVGRRPCRTGLARHRRQGAQDVSLTASAGTFTAAGSAWQATVGETIFGVTGEVSVSGNCRQGRLGQDRSLLRPADDGTDGGRPRAEGEGRDRDLGHVRSGREGRHHHRSTTPRAGSALVVAMPHHRGQPGLEGDLAGHVRQASSAP